MKNIILHSSKTASINRKHPWIFSGAIKLLPEGIQEGDLVTVSDQKSNYLGFGHYQHNNIAVKLLDFAPNNYTEEYWYTSLLNAYHLRQLQNLTDNSVTNCYRLVHGEGDKLPGLVIDNYADTAVIQCHSVGMFKNLNFITESLEKLYKGTLEHIYLKSKDTLPASLSSENKFIKGNKEILLIKENGLKFEINLSESQKTGFFLDQRENRKLLSQYSKDKIVLNTFCYTGGFSLYALSQECKQVDSIDSSAKAISQLNKNVELNFPNCSNHTSICEDAIHFLNMMPSDKYDLIVLDPPAFAKNISKRHNAIQAYKRINTTAIKKIKASGILFTFSCSQVVTEELFYNTIIASGIESGRQIQILHKLHQGPDHPVNLFHPEGAYLKGLVLLVH